MSDTEKIIADILARGNDVEVRKTKDGYKILEVSKKVAKVVVTETK